MKSDILKFDNNSIETASGIEIASKTALYNGYSKKNSAYLELLTEELIGLARQLLDVFQAELWIEADQKGYEIHLSAAADVPHERREELLKMATSGKNEFAKGFMGKLRQIFEVYLYSDSDTTNDMVYIPYMGGMMGGIENFGLVNEWSLSRYQLQKDAKEEEWDELEKSVVAKLADDITVGVKNGKVELVIKKKCV